jgi:valyl-tRNA synthetase
MAPVMALGLKDESKTSLVNENRDMIKLMARVERIEPRPYGSPRLSKSIAAVTGEWELFFPVGNLMDVGREMTRLQDELDNLTAEMDRIRGKLENKNFVERAPAEVVEKERTAMEEGEARKRRIEENLEALR